MGLPVAVIPVKPQKVLQKQITVLACGVKRDAKCTPIRIRSQNFDDQHPDNI
jgi:hypothetical protein